jgi:hypothetical protein
MSSEHEISGGLPKQTAEQQTVEAEYVPLNGHGHATGDELTLTLMERDQQNALGFARNPDNSLPLDKPAHARPSYNLAEDITAGDRAIIHRLTSSATGHQTEAKSLAAAQMEAPFRDSRTKIGAVRLKIAAPGSSS